MEKMNDRKVQFSCLKALALLCVVFLSHTVNTYAISDTKNDGLCEIFNEIQSVLNVEEVDIDEKTKIKNGDLLESYFKEVGRLVEKGVKSKCYDIKLMTEIYITMDFWAVDGGFLADEDVSNIIVTSIKYYYDEDLIKKYINYCLSSKNASERKSFLAKDIFDIDPNLFIEVLSAYTDDDKEILFASLSWGLLNYCDAFNGDDYENQYGADILKIYGMRIDQKKYKKEIDMLIDIIDNERIILSYPDFVLYEIAGIFLTDEKSGHAFADKYGNGCLYNLHPSMIGHLRAYYTSDKTESILIVKQPGGTTGYYADQIIVWDNKYIDILKNTFKSEVINDEFYYYVGEAATYNPLDCQENEKSILPFEKITSDKNIQIGIEKAHLKNMLGDPMEIRSFGEIEVFIYMASIDDDYEFLKRVNLPNYVGVYIFFRNSLIWYNTGYPNP